MDTCCFSEKFFYNTIFMLCDHEISLSAASDCMSALVLVEEMQSKRALSLFLEKRLEYIEEIFEEGASSISVKQQASTITHIILNTVQLTYALFEQGGAGSNANLIKLKSNLVRSYIKKAGSVGLKQVRL